MAMTRFQPNSEQAAALAAYAAKYGANWKARLSGDWQMGSDVLNTNGHLLRQLRNQGGPAWLQRYQLAAPVDAEQASDRKRLRASINRGALLG